MIGCIETRKNNLIDSYDLFYNNGRSKISKGLIEHVRYIETLGVGEILVNDISKEGTLSGYDAVGLSLFSAYWIHGYANGKLQHEKKRNMPKVILNHIESNHLYAFFQVQRYQRQQDFRLTYSYH